MAKMPALLGVCATKAKCAPSPAGAGYRASSGGLRHWGGAAQVDLFDAAPARGWLGLAALARRRGGWSAGGQDPTAVGPQMAAGLLTLRRSGGASSGRLLTGDRGWSGHRRGLRCLPGTCRRHWRRRRGRQAEATSAGYAGRNELGQRRGRGASQVEPGHLTGCGGQHAAADGGLSSDG